MSEETNIEWCDATWNPWIGCTKVSPGCANCYAEARSKRFGQDNWGKGKPRTRTSAAYWKQPLRWNWLNPMSCPECGASLTTKRQRGSGVPLVVEMCKCGSQKRPVDKGVRKRIFPSLCDWLDEEAPIEWLADFLKLIHDTPNLDWLLLTKRPENWRERLALALTCVMTHYPATDDRFLPAKMVENWLNGKPPPNIGLGVSVEDQQRADERIPELLKIPAKVRFLSAEPMLEEIKLPVYTNFKSAHRWMGNPEATAGIDWVIFGGESGPGARRCNVEWIRSGIRQCQAAGVPVFVKQLGAFPARDLSADIPEADERCAPEDIAAWEFNRHHTRIHFKDRKGGDMAEWPEDLRVREFPAAPQIR